MKSKEDPRHLRRKRAIQSLFAHSFGQKQPRTLLSIKVISKIGKIDQIITEVAPKWPIAKINHVDLAVLRLALWELHFEAKNPPKVIIDEAIELAKEYGSENSAAFVNGALGAYLEKYPLQGKKGEACGS